MFSKRRFIAHMHFSSGLRDWNGSSNGMEMVSTPNEPAKPLVLEPVFNAGSRDRFFGRRPVYSQETRAARGKAIFLRTKASACNVLRGESEVKREWGAAWHRWKECTDPSAYQFPALPAHQS
jgi:hypothetical protein